MALHAQISLHIMEGLTHRWLRIAVVLRLIVRLWCTHLPRASCNIGNFVPQHIQLSTDAVLHRDVNLIILFISCWPHNCYILAAWVLQCRRAKFSLTLSELLLLHIVVITGQHVDAFRVGLNLNTLIVSADEIYRGLLHIFISNLSAHLLLKCANTSHLALWVTLVNILYCTISSLSSLKISRHFHILWLHRSQVKYCLHRLYFAHYAVGWLLWDIELRHVGFGL